MKDLQSFVVLVDETNQSKGLMEKLEAHRQGKLHRAISVFIFNTKGEWLMQQRAAGKYHCPKKWSNACCTHPFHGEEASEAAKRRLYQELGIIAEINEWFQFVYRADLDNGLIEHEYDTVYCGITDEVPLINPEEVENYRYMAEEILDEKIRNQPDIFTPWFLKMYPRIKEMKKETAFASGKE